MVAYASINKKGETRLQATPPFNDGAALSETHDMEHIRNDSSHIGSINNKYTYRYTQWAHTITVLSVV